MTATTQVRSLVALVVLFGGVPGAAFLALRGWASATGPPDRETAVAWQQRCAWLAVAAGALGPAAAAALVGPDLVRAAGAAAATTSARTGVAVETAQFVGPMLGTAGFLAYLAGVVAAWLTVDRAFQSPVGARHVAGFQTLGFAAVATVALARLAVVVPVPNATAAAIVAAGWVVAAGAGPRLSVVLNAAEPLPSPWDDRVATLAAEHDVALAGAWCMPTEIGGEPGAEVVGSLPGQRPRLFATDRLFEVLEPDEAEAIVRRVLVAARRRSGTRTYALHVLVTVGWAASFQFVAVPTALLAGLALVVPYRLGHRWLHRRELYAADDAVAAAGYREELVDALLRVGEETGTAERRDPLVDLFVVEPPDEQRLRRLAE